MNDTGQPVFGDGPSTTGPTGSAPFYGALSGPNGSPVVIPSGDPDYNHILHPVAVSAGTCVAMEMTGTIKVVWQDGVLRVFNANRLMGMMDTTTGNAMNIVGHLLRDGVVIA